MFNQAKTFKFFYCDKKPLVKCLAILINFLFLSSITYHFLEKKLSTFSMVSHSKEVGLNSTLIYKCSFLKQSFLSIYLCKEREKAPKPQEISTPQEDTNNF